MITSVEQIKQLAIQEVELPGFEVGTTITVRLKKLSITGLAANGKIPNSLMGVVLNLFDNTTPLNKNAKVNTKNILDNLGDMSKLTDLICQQAMVEPKYEEVKNYLTDDQKAAIFEWTQRGANKVKPIVGE